MTSTDAATCARDRSRDSFCYGYGRESVLKSPFDFHFLNQESVQSSLPAHPCRYHQPRLPGTSPRQFGRCCIRESTAASILSNDCPAAGGGCKRPLRSMRKIVGQRSTF